MTKMNFATSTLLRATLVLGVSVLIVRPCLAADAAQALQGVWQGARFSEGKGEDPADGVKLELIFEGNHIKAKRLPAGNIGEGDFRLSSDGKTIDAVGSTGSFKGKNFPGIIKIEGDRLLWCTGTDGQPDNRPTEFVASPSKHTYLIIVKRQKQ
jgi:uncharacterized protein (TIGR03067 family)